MSSALQLRPGESAALRDAVEVGEEPGGCVRFLVGVAEAAADDWRSDESERRTARKEGGEREGE